MNPTPTIKCEMNLILCGHVCITTLYVLSFPIPDLFCFSIVKAGKPLSPTVLLGARMKWSSEKVWFSSPYPSEPQKSHSKPQKGSLGRLTNAPPTLVPQTCWTAMLELHGICLSITEGREFQEPQTSRGLLTTLLQD